MDDLISREAAINAVDEAWQRWDVTTIDQLRDKLNELLLVIPSAQPEPCEDAVSRKVIMRHYDSGEYKHVNHISRNGLLDYIEQLPSAQPESSQVARDIATIIENEKDMRVIAAQPEPIRINLNEPIKVKLTDWGKEIYYHQYDRTNQIAGREICKPRFPREDENGYTEFQLWCFIELYGMHMGMTLPNVIEPLEIVYER